MPFILITLLELIKQNKNHVIPDYLTKIDWRISSEVRTKVDLMGTTDGGITDGGTTDGGTTDGGTTDGGTTDGGTTDGGTTDGGITDGCYYFKRLFANICDTS